MQILGLGKLCFSYICPKLPKMSPKKMSGSDPNARDKEERQILFACKRRKRKKGTRRGNTEKRNKAGKNCRKYATEMKNAPPL